MLQVFGPPLWCFAHSQPLSLQGGSAQATHTASATWPTPDIADSAVLSASCARRCATETSNGDTARRGPGDAERPLDNERHRAKAEFGATCDCVAELPCVWCPAWTEDVVSS